MNKILVLQENVQSLIDKFVSLQKENAELKLQLDFQKSENVKQLIEINELQKNCRRLQTLNAMLGDENQKIKLKQYIASIIKKLDRALSVLKI